MLGFIQLMVKAERREKGTVLNRDRKKIRNKELKKLRHYFTL